MSQIIAKSNIVETGLYHRKYIGVSAGHQYSLGLKPDGTVVGVGRDLYGQMSGVSAWADISKAVAGVGHSAGLKSDGTAVAVGLNSGGQCNITGWTGLTDVSVGELHTLGLKSDGTVESAGFNTFGQCNVSGWTDIIAISATSRNSYGLKSDGTVVAVGTDADGQITWINIISNAIDIAGSHDGVFALEADGTVQRVISATYNQGSVSTWTDISEISAGYYGCLGLSSIGETIWTYQNLERTGVLRISAGTSHCLLQANDGTVVGYGSNIYGECDLDGAV